MRTDVGERPRRDRPSRDRAASRCRRRRRASPGGTCRAPGAARPSSPAAIRARSSRTIGWNRYTNGTGTDRARGALRVDAARRPTRRRGSSGFSQSTCLPCANAVVGERRVEVVGDAQVHDVDVGIGDQRLRRSRNARSAPRRAAASLARSGRRRRDPDQPGAGRGGRRAACAVPMNPTPTIPAPSSDGIPADPTENFFDCQDSTFVLDIAKLRRFE